MTYSPPPEPPSRDDNALGFDDFVGIFVAIAGIGTLLFWVLGPKMQQLNLASVESKSAPPPQTDPLILAPVGEATPTGISRNDQIAPSRSQPSSAALTPSPVPTAVQARPITPVPIPIPLDSKAPASTPTASASPIETGFSDVSPRFWAAPFIALLSQKGILTGFSDGTFRPNAPITRAEVAVMLKAAFDQTQNQQPLPFSDVPPDYWASSAIAESVQTGFMQGYPDGAFRPDQPISKVQLLIALVSGLDLPKPSNPTQVVQYYQDSGSIPPYAIDKVATATANRLVVNYPDLTFLQPEQPLTRADATALIYQALVQTGKADAVSSEYIVQP